MENAVSKETQEIFLKTYRKTIQDITWQEFKDLILQRSPFQLVNLPYWKKLLEVAKKGLEVAS